MEVQIGELILTDTLDSDGDIEMTTARYDEVSVFLDRAEAEQLIKHLQTVFGI